MRWLAALLALCLSAPALALEPQGDAPIKLM